MTDKRLLQYVVVIVLHLVGVIFTWAGLIGGFFFWWLFPLIAVGIYLWLKGRKYAERWDIDMYITGGGNGD